MAAFLTLYDAVYFILYFMAAFSLCHTLYDAIYFIFYFMTAFV